MAKFSTGLRNAMLATGSLRDTLDLGFIKIYGGALPATADAALGAATLLCTISNNSTVTGITLDAAAAAGVIAKEPSEVWSGDNVSSGTATFFRHVAPGDDGSDSDSQPRIQGTIATGGADLNVSSTALVALAPNAINNYTVALPTN